VATKRPARKGINAAQPELESSVNDLRVIARVLGLAVVKGRPLGEQAGTLAAAGFGTTEIAQMLGTTAASASQQIYMWRKSRKDRKKTARES
jgi:hypothetical protein